MLVQVTPELSLDPSEVLALKLDISKKVIEVWFRDPNLNVLPVSFKDAETPMREPELRRALVELTRIISNPIPDVMVTYGPDAKEAAE